MSNSKRNVLKLTLIAVLLFFVSIIYENKLTFVNYQEKDYNNIRDIIMGDKEITWYDLMRLDVNNDKKITSMDYVMIRNQIERNKNE